MNNDFPPEQPPMNATDRERPTSPATNRPNGNVNPQAMSDATPYERVKPYLLVDPSPRPGAFSDVDILNRDPRSGFEGVPAATQAPVPPPMPEQRVTTPPSPPPMAHAPLQQNNPPPAPSAPPPPPTLNPPPQQFNAPPAPQPFNPSPPPAQQFNASPPMQRFNPPPPPQTYVPPTPPSVAQQAPPPAQSHVPASAPPLPTQRVNAAPPIMFGTYSPMTPQAPMPAHTQPPVEQPQQQQASLPSMQQMPAGVVAYGASNQSSAPMTATPSVNNGPATQTHIASNMDVSDLVDAVFVEVTRQNNSGPRRG